VAVHYRIRVCSVEGGCWTEKLEELESQNLQIDDIPDARAPTLCACCASFVNRQTWVDFEQAQLGDHFGKAPRSRWAFLGGLWANFPLTAWAPPGWHPSIRTEALASSSAFSKLPRAPVCCNLPGRPPSAHGCPRGRRPNPSLAREAALPGPPSLPSTQYTVGPGMARRS
jgi:hypothetical protein